MVGECMRAGVGEVGRKKIPKSLLEYLIWEGTL